MEISSLLVIGLQTVAAAAAGAGLWLLWRSIARENRIAGTIVALGIALRAVGGSILFWIVYLELPIARGLQAGNGFWFFALDAGGYYRRAVAAAVNGVPAILFIDKGEPSPFYVQTLASAMLLFGTSAAVAALLNVIAYAAACVAAVRLGGSSYNRFTIAALAIFSFTPSLVLWSTQPLKDVIFLCAVILFVAAAAGWECAWRTRQPVLRSMLFGLALAACTYAIAGIRWYFGIPLLLSLGPVLLVAIARTRASRYAIAMAVATAIVCGAAFEFGAGPYLPARFRLITRAFASPAGTQSESLIVTMDRARAGFDRMPGGTRIGAGSTVAAIDGPAAAPAAGAAPVVLAAPAPPAASKPEPVARALTTAPEKPATPREPPAAIARTQTDERPEVKAIEVQPVRKAEAHAPPAVEEPKPAPVKQPEPLHVPAPLQQTAALKEPPPVKEPATVKEPPPAKEPATVKEPLPAKEPATAKEPLPVNTPEAAPMTSTRVASAPSTSTHQVPAPDLTTASAPASATVAATPLPAAPASADQHPAKTEPAVPASALTARTTTAPETQPAPVQTAKTNAPRIAAARTARKDTPRSETRAARQANVRRSPDAKAAATPEPPSPQPAAAAPVNGVARTASSSGGENAAEAGALKFPQSRSSRLIVGAAAIAMPRWLAQKLGVFQIHGGRGLWLFVEVDTLLFDAALLLAIAAVIAAGGRRAFSNPLFWVVVIMTLTIAVPVAYTVSNFGTLFRHRNMIFVGLILIPMILAAATPAPKAESAGEET